MTAQELLTLANQKYPEKKFALNKNQSILGMYSVALGRFKAVASLTITGQWVDMPFEILANGELPYTDVDFEPKEVCSC